jgi:hypothetical protein
MVVVGFGEREAWEGRERHTWRRCLDLHTQIYAHIEVGGARESKGRKKL